MPSSSGIPMPSADRTRPLKTATITAASTCTTTLLTTAPRCGSRRQPGYRPNSSTRNRSGSSSPPYLGPRGWVGLRLDVDLDWDEVATVVENAWRLVATKRQLAEHVR